MHNYWWGVEENVDDVGTVRLTMLSHWSSLLVRVCMTGEEGNNSKILYFRVGENEVPKA